MRTLLDNATITAALRATGHVPVTNRELFDLDVASLRILVDAIVLSDEIVVLDTYQAEHTDERKRLLSHDAIHFQTCSRELDTRFAREAVAHVQNWKLGRKLALEFAGVYDQLSLLFRHAWRNSESFLILKALGMRDKYNSAVVAGLYDLARPTPDLEDVRNNKWAKQYNRETHRVLQTLIWGAVRTVYYRQIAKLMGAEYMPHPLRNVFNIQCILFDNHPNTRKFKYHSEATIERPLGLHYPEEHIAAFIKGLWDTCNEADDNLFKIRTFDAEIPPFLGVVMKRLSAMEGPDQVLKLAFDLRRDPGCEALRRRLSEAWNTDDGVESVKVIRQFLSDLRSLRQRLQVYLGYDREKISLSAKVVSYTATVPRCMTRPFYPHKPHLGFIRDVVLELASVGTMGRLMDRLWGLDGRQTLVDVDRSDGLT